MNAEKTIRVMVADDHSVVREGLKQILDETPDLCVGGEAVNGDDLLEQISNSNWSVLILDITMPGKNGLELLKDVKSRRPELPVLILSMHSEEQYAIRALRSGASGYLTKDSIPEELVDAIRKIYNGGRYINVSFAEKLSDWLGDPSDTPIHERLSDRELQIFLKIAQGTSGTEIAQELQLGKSTVSTYRTRILRKMKMKSNAELIQYAYKNGLLT